MSLKCPLAAVAFYIYYKEYNFFKVLLFGTFSAVESAPFKVFTGTRLELLQVPYANWNRLWFALELP